jgi:hypothetical protein
MPTARKAYKNRTIRIPADLLQRVQVKLAKEDRKLSSLVVEHLARWSADGAADGLTPGQRVVRDFAALRKKAKFKVPAVIDKAALMGESDE